MTWRSQKNRANQPGKQISEEFNGEDQEELWHRTLSMGLKVQNLTLRMLHHARENSTKISQGSQCVFRLALKGSSGDQPQEDLDETYGRKTY